MATVWMYAILLGVFFVFFVLFFVLVRFTTCPVNYTHNLPFPVNTLYYYYYHYYCGYGDLKKQAWFDVSRIAHDNVTTQWNRPCFLPHNTLGRSAQDISLMQALRQLVKLVDNFLTLLRTKLVTFRELAAPSTSTPPLSTSSSASLPSPSPLPSEQVATTAAAATFSRRQQNSFYKLLGCVEVFLDFSTLVLMLIVERGLLHLDHHTNSDVKNSAPLTFKTVTRISSVFQRALQNVEENMWQVLLDSFERDVWQTGLSTTLERALRL